MIDRSVVGAHLLRGQAERVLIGDEYEGKVVVPQVLIKTVGSRQIQKALYFSVNICDQLLRRLVSVCRKPALLL